MKNRVAQYSIVLGENYSPIEGLAADELASFVYRISNTWLPQIHEPQKPAGPAIFLGQTSAIKKYHLRQKVSKIRNDGFVIEWADEHIIIAGRDDDGTLFGAYEFLEWLGIRWFMPGQFGTILPRASTINLQRQSVI